ncbi:YegP family protein [Rubricoccus marinus]|uniref:DUF1508 domain-containing protein n=1 Tax=Rubricoccus marinus TaxID=716817 RepID=A0A259TUM3_9BACT|nr:DUF1508 domain-containing protein [Rubricoccus marinus]OZC01443.1 hypothetical protein BSZ36_17350 [Rubricoccus marinus]
MFETLSGDTTWRFVALNGRIIADSAQTFRSRAAAERAVAAFVASVSGAPVLVSGSEIEAPAFVVYLSGSGDWRWSLRAANGQVLAESADGYASKDACVQAARRVGDLAAGIQP